MFYLILNEKVVQKSSKTFPVAPELQWIEARDDAAEVEWVYRDDQFIQPAQIALDYKKKREREYPAIGDQLDMLWHSMDSGEIPKSAEFYNKIKSVKDKYPKN